VRTLASATTHPILRGIGESSALGDVHSLRHAAGTRLFAETLDLEETARHLGHGKLETTRIYTTWSDRRRRETLSRW